MAARAETKLRESQGRHTIYLPSELVRDSAFPFGVGDRLVARVEGARLVVEKAKAER